jgi:hypothetical protein
MVIFLFPENLKYHIISKYMPVATQEKREPLVRLVGIGAGIRALELPDTQKER